MKIKILILGMISILLVGLSLNFVLSQEVKYCCERTDYGAWCQDALEQECDESYRSTPTSCEATSYCKLGTCYDSSEGLCMENTPQKVCDNVGGTWSEKEVDEVPQCQDGCCILGGQASFVTLTRCKKLSAFYGLQTDFRTDINSELQCISLASLSDEGACVFEIDYIKTCKFVTRQECTSISEGMQLENGSITGKVEFHKDFLCSAEELGTNCGLTKETTCVDGKDEVYFVDSCGNIANIYDSSKVDDKAYWRKKISKLDSCNSNSANINSKSCGNCNYFEGSICKNYKDAKTSKPKYGDFICQDLNCKETSLGKPMKHGESWCSTDKYEDSVGSRYFRHICINGEEIVEPCGDFRQEICIEDSIETDKGDFSQAGCVVNRWQDCYSQSEKIDCENTDKRDCEWIYDDDELDDDDEGLVVCFPKHSPGLEFWEVGGSEGICSQADTQCIVTKKKEGIAFRDTKYSGECVDSGGNLKDSWINEQLERCESIGDCGAKVNLVGKEGNKDGYDIKEEDVDDDDDDGGLGGLFGLHLVLDKLGITGKAVDEDEEVK